MGTTRVVIADDHASVRAGVRRILQRAPGIEVVGEAGNGVEAIHLVNQLAPDILLLDVEMPLLNGIEVARELHSAGSPVRILVLSSYDDKEYIQELLANGASGYLTKDDAPFSVVDAIQGVSRGERGWFSPRAMTKLAA